MSALSIIEALIAREGGYVNNVNDLGGATCWGITEKVARAHGYAGEMAKLPKLFAIELYNDQYINKPGFDKILAISPVVAEKMIDIGVNMGVSIPGPWLQEILNLLNQQAQAFPDLMVDGEIGGATLSALRAVIAKRGVNGTKVIARTLNCLQGARYFEITKKRPQNEAFFYGWMLNRVGDV